MLRAVQFLGPKLHSAWLSLFHYLIACCDGYYIVRTFNFSDSFILQTLQEPSSLPREEERELLRMM